MMFSFFLEYLEALTTKASLLCKFHVLKIEVAQRSLWLPLFLLFFFFFGKDAGQRLILVRLALTRQRFG